MIALAVCSLAVLAYTYVGYPVLVAALAKIRPLQVRADPSWRPRVSVLVPVVDAAPLIGPKLDSLRAQDYPPELLEFVFCSDGSTDDTDAELAAQAARDSRVRALRNPERSGKPTALERMRLEATGEVLVLTDIRQLLDEGAISSLVAHLGDERVGAVSGKLVLVGSQGAGLYWRYESWIRRSEARFRSMVGATGPLYALRAADLGAIPPDTILDDMWIPMRLRLQGRLLLLADDAVAYDEAFADDRELVRKVRTLAGNYQLFARLPRLLSPLSNPSWFETVSHKLLRLVCPWALAALAVASSVALVTSPAHRLALGALVAGQLVFYLAAALGSGAGRFGRLARTFVLLHVAAVMGLVRAIRGRQAVTWETRAR